MSKLHDNVFLVCPRNVRTRVSDDLTLLTCKHCNFAKYAFFLGKMSIKLLPPQGPKTSLMYLLEYFLWDNVSLICPCLEDNLTTSSNDALIPVTTDFVQLILVHDAARETAVHAPYLRTIKATSLPYLEIT